MFREKVYTGKWRAATSPAIFDALMNKKISGYFAPVPWAAFDYIAKHGTPTHTHVLTAILRGINFKTGDIRMTVDEVAQSSNLSRETVKRAIKWLEDRDVLHSKVLPQNKGKRYIVNQSGEFVNPERGVTHDPKVGSPMTPLQRSEQALCRIENREIVVLVENREETNVSSLFTPAAYKVNEANGDIFDKVILGADPDEEEVKPDKKQKAPTSRKRAPESVEVLDWFNFIARQSGAAPIINQQDRIYFLAQTKRALHSGLTVRSLRLVIEAFFQFDRHREHVAAWKVFYLKATQRQLISTVEGVSIDIKDPVLSWISHDFSRTSALPWDESFDSEFQNVVYSRGISVAFRYPEILASIARLSASNRQTASTLVTAAAAMIDAYVSGEDPAPHREPLVRAGVVLPKELTKKTKTIRPEAGTLQEAVIIAVSLSPQLPKEPPNVSQSTAHRMEDPSLVAESLS